jgi:hypothetical protein
MDPGRGYHSTVQHLTKHETEAARREFASVLGGPDYFAANAAGKDGYTLKCLLSFRPCAW